MFRNAEQVLQRENCRSLVLAQHPANGTVVGPSGHPFQNPCPCATI
jgi:hypothetical protein